MAPTNAQTALQSQTSAPPVDVPTIDASTIQPLEGANTSNPSDPAGAPQIDLSTVKPIPGVAQPTGMAAGQPIPSDAKITAAKPKSFLDSLRDMFETSNPNYTSETNQAFQEHGPELINLRVGSPQDQANHPILSKIDDWLSSMTSPTNAAVIAGSGGFGALLESLPKAGQILPRLVSGGFSAQQIASVVKNVPAAREAWSNGNVGGLESIMTQMTLDTAAALLGGSHAVQGEAAGKPLFPGMDEAIKDYTQGFVDKTANTAGKATGAAAGVAGEIGNAVPGAVTEKIKPVGRVLGLMREFNEELRAASPPTKGAAANGYAQSLERAKPQLIQIMQDAPNATDLPSMIDAIETHRSGVEKTLVTLAEEQQGARNAINGVRDRVLSSVSNEFKRLGAQYKPQEKAQAMDAVRSFMNQDAGVDSVGNPVYRDPNLPELEDIRQRFGKDTENVFGQLPGVVTPAEKIAKYAAAQEIRKAIDQKFDDLGVKNVKEWRSQEAALIDVRDQLTQGLKKAEESGTGPLSAFTNLIKQRGWGVLPALVGYNAGGPLGALGATGALYLHERATNPNKAIDRASKQAQKYGPSGAAIPYITPRFFQGNEAGPTSSGSGSGSASTPGSGLAETGESGITPANPGSAIIPGNPGSIISPVSTAEFTPPEGGPVGPVVPLEEPIQKTPASKLPDGYDDQGLLHHETGHAAVGHLLGFEPIEITSHLHPDVKSRGSSAEVPFDWGKLSTDKSGAVPPEAIAEKMDDFLTMYMAGGAAQETMGGLPMEENLGMAGDKKAAANMLKILGYSSDEAADRIEDAKIRAKQLLSHPDVRDIVGRYSSGREIGLDKTLHMSSDKMRAMRDELDQVKGESNDRNSKGNGENNSELAKTDVAGAESKNPKDDGSKTSGKSSSESSGGVAIPAVEGRKFTTPPEKDMGHLNAPIKAGGGIPGGIQPGLPEYGVKDLAMFHDPQTGTTLALPADKITPETVRAKIEASRAAYKKVDTGKEKGDNTPGKTQGGINALSGK